MNNEFGDWGLGIGDCPIPNPQSPSQLHSYIKIYKIKLLINYNFNRISYIYIKYYHIINIKYNNYISYNEFY